MALAAQRLGYGIELTTDSKGVVTGWEIAGISQELREKQSSRSASIEAAAVAFEKEHGRAPSAAERRVLSLETRSEKMLESSQAGNEALQRSKYTAAEIEKIELVKAEALTSASLLHPPTIESVREAINFARNHLFERHSALAAHEVLAEAINFSMGRIEPALLSAALENDPQIVSLVGSGSTAILTTRENLTLESDLVTNCLQRQGGEESFASRKEAGDLSQWTKANKGFALSTEQQESVAHVLSSKDGLFSIRGVAGAGKTTMLQEVNYQLEERGASMLYLAPTASAVDTLRKEGFDNAMTIASYLIEAKKNPEKFQGKMVFVDEAGLMSVRSGHQVQMLADRLKQRVCLVGDIRQHTSVEAGDYLRILEDHGKLVSGELTGITRQRPPEYRSAISSFASGNYVEGWETLHRMKAIHESQASYLQEAASDYLAKANGGVDLDRVLCVAPTHAELDSLNENIRSGLKTSGYLPDSEFKIDSFRSDNRTTAQKRSIDTYSVGDVVVFQQSGVNAAVAEIDKARSVITLDDGRTISLRKDPCSHFDVGKLVKIGVSKNEKLLIRANDKGSGLINGQILTVSTVNPDGSLLAVDKNSPGKDSFTIPAGFVKVQHGYAVTSHASQGKTVDHVVVAAVKMDAKALYVSTSRGRQSVAVHVADHEFMSSALRDSSRTSAQDVLAAQQKAYEAARSSFHSPASPKSRARNIEEVKRRRQEISRSKGNLITPYPHDRSREQGGREL